MRNRGRKRERVIYHYLENKFLEESNYVITYFLPSPNSIVMCLADSRYSPNVCRQKEGLVKPVYLFHSLQDYSGALVYTCAYGGLETGMEKRNSEAGDLEL